MDRIKVWFKNTRDLSKALNKIIKLGFDPQRFSVILLDRRHFKNALEADEQAEFEESYGDIWAIKTAVSETEPVHVPEIGEVIIAGPIVVEDNLDVINMRKDSLEQQSRFYLALKNLGVNGKEVKNYVQRIKNRGIIVVLDINQFQQEEIKKIIRDFDGELITF